LKNYPKRNAILLIDGAGSHTGAANKKYPNLVIKILPPNTTSHIQPLDAGIIHSVKAHYKKNLVLRTLQQYDKDLPIQLIDIKQALDYFSAAWKNVTPETIKNCWRKTEILPLDVQMTLAQDKEVKQLQTSSEMAELINIFNVRCSTKEELIDERQVLEFFDCDASEPTEAELPDEQLVLDVLEDSNIHMPPPSDDEEEDVVDVTEEKIPNISLAEAITRLTELRKFYERLSGQKGWGLQVEAMKENDT
jgi:hypothetical protein